MRTYGVERLGALSDGVFAVIATLLVLELKLPDPPLPGRELGTELVANIPAFVGWLVSFVVLARFWMVHHHVLDVLARCSTSTIVWNFIFLGSISLLPFGASLIGTYEFEFTGPIVLFALGLGLSAIALGLLAQHVAHSDDLRQAKDHDLDRVWRYHSLVVPSLMSAAALTAVFHPAIGFMVLMAESVAVLILWLSSSANRLPEAAPDANGS